MAEVVSYIDAFQLVYDQTLSQVIGHYHIQIL